MASLLRLTKKFIVDNELFSKEDALLLAVSGGVDSISLAHILVSLGFNIGIAHCNFQLRGNESDHDEKLCKKFASDNQVTFFSKKFSTNEFAKTNNLSIQMAARSLRYEWFGQLMEEKNYSKLVTAHHANDQVETAVFNLTKGTGISGLRGMPYSDEKLVRPLIFAHKNDIRHYARENHLQWREDASNLEDKYHRNRIRNTIIPKLEAINPNLINTMVKNFDRLKSVEALLLKNTEDVKKKYWTESNGVIELNMEWFDENGGLAILEQLLKAFNFSFDQTTKVASSLRFGSGNRFETDQVSLTVDRNRLFISRLNKKTVTAVQVDQQNTELSIDSKIFQFKISNDLHYRQDTQQAFLDFDKLKFPLLARPWQEGDRFVPLGMKGQKKVSDFMIDEKIPVNLKERLVVFESDQEIIWIAGYRISDRFKITENTQRVYHIKISNNA